MVGVLWAWAVLWAQGQWDQDLSLALELITYSALMKGGVGVGGFVLPQLNVPDFVDSPGKALPSLGSGCMGRGACLGEKVGEGARAEEGRGTVVGM